MDWNNNDQNISENSIFSVRVDGMTVIADIRIRKSPNRKPVDLTVSLDFSGTTATQILLWAARTKLNEIQRELRSYDLDFLRDLAKRGILRRKACESKTGFDATKKAKQPEPSHFLSLSPEDQQALIHLLKNNL